jgi:hypothetical protein
MPCAPASINAASNLTQATVTDVFSRCIVDWRVSNFLHPDLALDALDMAIRRRQHQCQDLTTLIHHRVQAGFKESAQHYHTELRCTNASGVDLIGRYEPGCGRQVVRQSHIERIGNVFWAAIARGLTTEDAAEAAGISPAVGSRWFRHNGGIPSVSQAPFSSRYLSFVE